MPNVPPGLILIAGALLVAVLPSRLRPWAFIGAGALASFHLVVVLEAGAVWTTRWWGMEITPLRVDDLSLVFGYVFGILALLGGVFALHLRDRAQQVAALLYGGGALGVVFAGDLLTLVVGWELMAVASVVLILNGGTPHSKGAALRYLFVHIVGGSTLLAGVLWHVGQGGGLAFDAFDATAASWLILGGVAINAAAVPLHAWLTDAYPEASITGAVFLGGFTTKTAVYVLARGFPEWEILIWAGVLMAVYGVAYALVQNDIRRMLAYDIVSQVGFMVVAIGIGGHGGINAAAAHAFVHVLYNALLFMAVGALIYSTGRSTLTALGGVGRALPWVFGLYMVGALSVSALPGFNAFVTKSLVIHAAEEEGLRWVVLLLYAVAAGTFVAAGLRIPYLLLRDRTPAIVERAVPKGMLAAMATAAILCIGIGLYPSLIYDVLPFEVDAHPYAGANVVRTLQLLGFAAVGFWLLRRRLGASEATVLDVDWLYRRAGHPVRVLLQEPLEQLLTRAEMATAWLTARVTPLGAPRDDSGSMLSTSRLPLSAAIAAILVMLGMLVIVAMVR